MLMYKYSLGGIIMQYNTNKLAVGVLSLMHHNFVVKESGIGFNVGGGNILYVPHKEFESPMVKSLLERNVFEAYERWCEAQGEPQVNSSLYEIYTTMYNKFDKTSQEFLALNAQGLLFDPNLKEYGEECGAPSASDLVCEGELVR